MKCRPSVLTAGVLLLAWLPACNQGARGGGSSVKADTNPWFAAAESNSASALAAATSSGADVNAHEARDFNTPLHVAAIHGNTEAIRALLAKGARADAVDEDGRTPLIIACHHSKTPAALALIGTSAGLDVRDRQQQTALMFAAKNGNLEIVRAILAQRISTLDAQRTDGWTALHIAARQGHAEVARALKSAGASTTIRDRRGRTALDLATASRQTAAAAALQAP